MLGRGTFLHHQQHRGHYITNLNNALVYGKSLKITIHVQCLIPQNRYFNDPCSMKLSSMFPCQTSPVVSRFFISCATAPSWSPEYNFSTWPLLTVFPCVSIVTEVTYCALTFCWKTFYCWKLIFWNHFKQISFALFFACGHFTISKKSSKISKVNHYFGHVDNLHFSLHHAISVCWWLTVIHPPSLRRCPCGMDAAGKCNVGKLGAICEDMVNVKSKKYPKANVPHGLLKSACAIWMYVLLLLVSQCQRLFY